MATTAALSGINLAQIPRLNGANYFDWVFAVQMVLQRVDAWEVTSGEEPLASDAAAKVVESWTKKSKEGLTVVGLTVEPSQYVYIRTAKTGPEAFKALADVYKKSSRANRMQLKRRFYRYEHPRGTSMQDYINTITNLAMQLRAISVQISDDDIVDVMIMSLTDDYAHLGTALASQSSQLSLADVTGAILDEQMRLNPHLSADPHEVTLFSKKKSHETRRCYNCNKIGHLARDCPDKDNKAETSHYSRVNDTLPDVAY